MTRWNRAVVGLMLIRVIAAAGLTLCMTTLHAQLLRPTDVYRLASPSVVIVHGLGAPDGAQGSGVVIRPGEIVSNCHVLETSTRVEVIWNDTLHPARLLHADTERDLCSLSAPTVKAPPARIGDSTVLEVGDPIYAIGAPRGLSFTLSDGLISGRRGEVLQITAPISPGSSGGGLFNAKGELVGVTTLFLKESQQLNFAFPVEWVLQLPTRHRPQLPGEYRKGTGFAPGATAPVLRAPPGGATFEVLNVILGPRLGADNRVQDPRSVFNGVEKIYASVHTTGTSAVRLVARWRYGFEEDAKTTVYENTIRVPPGSHLTAFHIENPIPWPTGTYDLQLLVDDREIGGARFCVEDTRNVCKLAVGEVYSYKKDGIRHYSSRPPSGGAEEMRKIRYAFYTLEARR